jgi:hypothetical protein
VKLQQGDKGLVGNAGYRRFLATPREGHFEIDADRASGEGVSQFGRWIQQS